MFAQPSPERQMGRQMQAIFPPTLLVKELVRHLLTNSKWLMETGGCLNMKMPSYQYRDSHVKDKTVSDRLILTWESPYLVKTVFILRRAQITRPSLALLILCCLKRNLQMWIGHCFLPNYLLWCYLHTETTRACHNTNTIFQGTEIPIIKVRWYCDYLIFMMGIPILVRWDFHMK